MPSPIYATCLERQMHGYLVELGLSPGYDFYEQHPFSSYVLDFAFIHSRNPFRGLDLEVDGAKWHSSGKQRSRDAYRQWRLHKAGWLTERVGEMFTIEDVEKILIKHGVLPPK